MKPKMTTFLSQFSFYSKKKRILVFGDSNSIRPNRKECWPTLVKKKLGGRLRLINDSSDGRTMMYDQGNRNGFFVFKKKLKIYMPLDFIVIMLGTNDIKMRYGPPMTGEIINNLELMLDYIYANCEKVKPILLLPPPIGNKGSGDFRGATHRAIQLTTAIFLLARERGINTIDLHSILDLKNDMENDLIHLNHLGRQKVADSICKYFIENL